MARWLCSRMTIALLLGWVVMLALIPFFRNDPYRGLASGTTPFSLLPSSGDRIALPDRDAFGKASPRQSFMLVFMPSCTACALKRVPLDRLPDRLALAFPEPVDVLVRQYGRRALNRFYGYAPPTGDLPAIYLSSAPSAIALGPDRRVRAVIRQGEDVLQFIGEQQR